MKLRKQIPNASGAANSYSLDLRLRLRLRLRLAPFQQRKVQVGRQTEGAEMTSKAAEPRLGRRGGRWVLRAFPVSLPSQPASPPPRLGCSLA